MWYLCLWRLPSSLLSFLISILLPPRAADHLLQQQNQACRLAPRAFSFLTALLVSGYRAGAKPGTWVWCTTPDPFPCWPFWAWPIIYNSKSSSQMVYGFCMSFHGQNDNSVNYANNHCAVTSFWSVSAKHSASVVSSESHHNSIACVLVSSPFCKRGKRVLEGGVLTLPSPLPSSGQLGPWRWAWIWSPNIRPFFKILLEKSSQTLLTHFLAVIKSCLRTVP